MADATEDQTPTTDAAESVAEENPTADAPSVDADPDDEVAADDAEAAAATDAGEPAVLEIDAVDAADAAAVTATDAVEPEVDAAPVDAEAAAGAPAEPQPEAEPAAAPEPQPEPAAAPEAPTEPEKPALPTAVSLGLLPEVFVSAVSTQLHFYAPELPPLPARDEADEQDDDDAPVERTSANARRRNRRRGGAATGSGADEQAEAPAAPVRQRAVELITEPQRIKGSTRLEAKKQRRRDGREAGRRRPVVTEAEFLARREAVDRVMVVRSKSGRIQIGVLEDNVLVEHYVARNQDASLIGNVYLPVRFHVPRWVVF